MASIFQRRSVSLRGSMESAGEFTGSNVRDRFYYEVLKDIFLFPGAPEKLITAL